jgi:hypothetical protein
MMVMTQQTAATLTALKTPAAVWEAPKATQPCAKTAWTMMLIHSWTAQTRIATGSMNARLTLKFVTMRPTTMATV